MILLPRERRFELYHQWRAWLLTLGVCAACGIALALWLVERDSVAPSLPLPCRAPKWRGAKCTDLVREAWATRPERKAA